MTDTATESRESPLHWHETLRDGSKVLIRGINNGDVLLERDFIERLSPQSHANRFLGHLKVTDRAIRRLTDINHRYEVALVALRHEKRQTREIGVARFYASPGGSSCECAIAVSDDWQGKGLGHALMRHLIDSARSRGIGLMYSIDFAGNQQMRKLATSLGFEEEVDPDYPSQVIHYLRL